MFAFASNPIIRRGSSFKRALSLIKNQPKRGLKLHEYQAGQLLDSHNVPIALVSKDNVTNRVMWHIQLKKLKLLQKNSLPVILLLSKLR